MNDEELEALRRECEKYGGRLRMRCAQLIEEVLRLRGSKERVKEQLEWLNRNITSASQLEIIRAINVALAESENGKSNN